MGASITLAGEDLIAQKQGAQEALNITRFIFANVPGLDPSAPLDRAAPMPPAGQIVHQHLIPADHRGYVNPSQVVYSAQIGSDVGDWDFNWIGLESAEGVLFAVATVALQQKRRNIPPIQVGNNLTRNFLVVFDGAQALTGITIDASTWQHDFTVRLAGIDERERQSNRDIYGRACFFGSALQLEKVGAAYQLKPGTAYIEGIRLQATQVQTVAPPAFPTTAWLDVALQRELSDVVVAWSTAWGAGKTDYVDSAGVQHYMVQIAELPDSSTVTDVRPVENIAGPLVKHFAPLHSPAFSGNPTAPTPALVANNEQLANTEFVQRLIEAIIDLAPVELNTIGKLARSKAALLSPIFTGDPKAPTPAFGDNDTSIATTAFVQSAAGAMLTKDVAGAANVNLSVLESRYPILYLTGTLTASISLVVPAASRKWLVINKTTGKFLLTVRTAAGEGVVVPRGSAQQLYCDGTHVGLAGIAQSNAPLGYVSGLELRNNAASPTNRIDVSAGIASSSDGLVTLRLEESITKNLQSSGAWAAGSGANGLFAGVAATNTWYHVFAIQRDIDGAVDIGFDTSDVAANRPAGYTAFRRLTSIRTAADKSIIPFLQVGRGIQWKTPILDVVAASLNGSMTYTISVPPGRRVRARLQVNVVGGDAGIYVRAPELPDVSVSITSASYKGGLIMATGSVPDYAAFPVDVVTNTDSQIAMSPVMSSTTTIATLGWEEL